MTIQDLQECGKIIAEMESIKEQIELLEAKLYYAKQPKIDGMPHSSSAGDGSDMIVKYLDTKANYEKLYAQLAIKVQEVEKAMEAKLDSRERQAIRYRYIQALSISEVADKMAYTERQVHRILRDAEDKLCQ